MPVQQAPAQQAPAQELSIDEQFRLWLNPQTAAEKQQKRQVLENARNEGLRITDKAIAEARRFAPFIGRTGVKFYEQLNDRREWIQKLDDEDLEYIKSSLVLDPLVIANNGEGFRNLLKEWAAQNQQRAAQMAAQRQAQLAA